MTQLSLTEAEWQQIKNELDELHTQDDELRDFVTGLVNLAEQVEDKQMSIDDAKMALLVMAVD